MRQDIRFGASISTSGRYALQGVQALAGLQAWVGATNLQGGLRLPGSGGGRPAALVHYDDASSPANAVANVERLIRADRVDVLIGPYGSDLVRAVIPAARRRGRLLWNHGGAADDVHRPGGLVVGIPTPVSRYFAGPLQLLRRSHPDWRRVAVLRPRGSRFGLLAARGARVAGKQVGLAVIETAYSSLKRELPQIVERLRRQRPDLIISAGSFQDDCTLAREGITGRTVARAFACIAAGLREFGTLGGAAEGVFAPCQWEPDAAPVPDFGPAASEVAQRLRAAGAAPDYPAAQAYAACLIAQRCLEQAGSTDDEALWRAACALDCATFFGRFRIDPRTGLQVGHGLLCVQWQGGKKVVVWPPSLAQARPVYPLL